MLTLISIAFSAWFLSNYLPLKGSNPEKVAIDFATQFQKISPASINVVKLDTYEHPKLAFSNVTNYVIQNKDKTQELCKVSVRTFLNLGYAPESYEHLNGKQ